MKKFLLKISKPVLALELGFIALPISFLLILGAAMAVKSALEYPSFGNSIFAITGLLSAMAVAGIFVLGYKVLFSCDGNVIKEKFLWSLLYIGVLIVLISGISSVLPPSQPYSQIAEIREDVELFILGGPLIILAFHLRLEASKCF